MHCYSAVTDTPLGADILQGARGVLYRRWMFGPDFMHLPLFVAKTTLRARLSGWRDQAAAVEQTDADATHADSSAKSPLTASQLQSAIALGERVLASVGGLPAHVEARLARLSPPAHLFLVDDVVISGYLHSKGIPRLVVPDSEGGPPPVPLVAERHQPWELTMPVVHASGRALIADTDSLHSEKAFDPANAAAVAFLHALGWW